MNTSYWTDLSIEFANQRNYLDELFRVYPTIPEGLRVVDSNVWEKVEHQFNQQNNLELLKILLKLPLFPIKDSYVAFLKRSPNALANNPQTVNRLCGRLYEMGLEALYLRVTEAKETNRQIGPMFRRWIEAGSLGVPLLRTADFLATAENAILTGSDSFLKKFASEHLNYLSASEKGLDFVGRFNGQYVIGEAKFLTDFGGHQNAQFDDAMRLFEQPNLKALPIAILDGVLYIEGKNKLYTRTKQLAQTKAIVSSLCLREFLFSI
ncbi:MAG: restriction endonuclease [Vampirovibrio sp.]|nr:restriction endonuclease [Vampirovibrio sp.]